ncbi:MAG: hypothetical protein AB1483_12280 [Candidatus Zixiibacteriota bacterium]
MKKFKKYLIWSAVIVAGLFAILITPIIYWSVTSDARPYEEIRKDIRRIELGMSKEDVLEIMGQPVAVRRAELETWLFDDHPLLSEPPRCSFDQSGRVVGIVCDDDYRIWAEGVGCGSSSILYVGGYPTPQEIDLQIERYREATDPGPRVDTLKAMLKSLSNPTSVGEDMIIRGTLSELAEIYLKEHDEAILIAVDETPIQAGFANFVCDFYSNLAEDSLFRERYRRDNGPLKRCVGISFSESEVDSLLKGE